MQQGGFLKTGTRDVAGKIVLTFGSKVAKVQIVCHDFYIPSDQYPTNSNKVSVNGSEAVLAPYNEEGTFGTLTFDLATASETVTIDCSKRVFIQKIIVTFADADGEDTPPLPTE